LIAEEVAKVNPDLVTRDRNGETYSVRYESVNAMLLNEFIKQHKALLEEQRKVQEQRTAITQLKSTVAQQQKDFQATVEQLTKRAHEQASQIQKVSAQLVAAVCPVADLKRANSPEDESAVADLRRKWSTIRKAGRR
jgi:hypothetical protein